MARRRSVQLRGGWGLLALPALLFLLVFFVYPTVEMVRYSVTDFTTGQHGFFANYAWFFKSDANLRVLIRTLTTAGMVTVVCLVLSFPYAYLMTLVSPRWRLVMLGVVLVPFWTSLMVRTYAWLVLLQDTGVINDIARKLGFGQLQLIGTRNGVLIGMCQILLPFMVLPLYASLRAIDRRLLTAAESLGASPSAAFRQVYLPLSLPGLLTGALFVFVLSLGFYLTPAILGSPQQALLSQLIVTQTQNLLAFGRAGAMAVVLLLATLAVLAASAIASRRSRVRIGGVQR